MASIGGFIDSINSPNMLDLFATTLFETIFTGSISMFGAYSGGQLAGKYPYLLQGLLSGDRNLEIQRQIGLEFNVILGIVGLGIMILTAE
ncbi:uncharacterized protein TRUGW13939_11067 [Talaromyces rugulosus]|uniref:Uncharacterized protein n=1 Tax=Talaromyces rugulosus TaxID=121627 RepID=A0A7H8REF2_TALRU|nr:uncharacterized protein TRUGW13939_11067 [Talaromyces rugulosus]QKX63895.1 hypothetical protein TRUGW13939_11067 [Talaromyces rugulosus]